MGARLRVLVVQRTGWGKSLVYLLATRLLRDAGAGPTLLISPLLALMRDQIRMAETIGVRACTINSGNVDEWAEVERALTRDDVDILLVSPERHFERDVHVANGASHAARNRPLRRRRGALHLGLGARLPSGLSPDPSRRRSTAPLRARLGHDCHGEQPRRRGYRRPARQRTRRSSGARSPGRVSACRSSRCEIRQNGSRGWRGISSGSQARGSSTASPSPTASESRTG